MHSRTGADAAADMGFELAQRLVGELEMVRMGVALVGARLPDAAIELTQSHAAILG